MQPRHQLRMAAFPRVVWRLWWSFVCLPIKAVDALVLGDNALLLPPSRSTAAQAT